MLTCIDALTLSTTLANHGYAAHPEERHGDVGAMIMALLGCYLLTRCLLRLPFGFLEASLILIPCVLPFLCIRRR